MYKKLVCWYILTIFHRKHGSLAFIYIYIYKKIHHKMKSPKILQCSIPFKNTQNLVSGIYKIPIFRKTESFSTFCLFFSKAWFLGIIYTSFQKDLSELPTNSTTLKLCLFTLYKMKKHLSNRWLFHL